MGVLIYLWNWIAESLGLARIKVAEPEESREEAPREQGESPDVEEAGVPISPSRRAFLAKLSIALGGLAALIAGIPVIGVLVSPTVRPNGEVWRDIGAVDDFQIGNTVSVIFTDPSPLPWAGPAAQRAAYLRRIGGEEFIVFSVYCTHTGCPVNWAPGARLFLCPCHGGVFYSDGTVAAGPPPRPLDRMPWRVRNGRVELLTTPVPAAA